MAKYSRSKGNLFERTIAKEILKAAGEKKFSKEDCFRTPQSGGYQTSGWRFDLVISPRLLKVFPYGVECKFHKYVDFQHFYTGRGLLRKWIAQVLAAYKEYQKIRGRRLLYPIVVFRWNQSKTFCIIPNDHMIGEFKTRLVFQSKDRVWKCVLFTAFLRKVFCQRVK
jgi:hypothetical protein